jgi:hypothetical protein
MIVLSFLLEIVSAAFYESEPLVEENALCPFDCPTKTIAGNVFCHEICNIRECDWDKGKCLSTSLIIIGHIASLGDRFFYDSEWVGTKSQDLRLEGIQIDYKDKRLLDVLEIEYAGELKDKGRTDWTNIGEFMGTRGEWRAMELLAIRIKKDLYSRFRVNYRCYVNGVADSVTYSDGEFCGVKGKQIEAIYVWIQRNIEFQ